MVDTKYMYPNNYTKEFRQFAQKDYRRNEKLSIKVVENGLVLPLKVSETGVPLLGYGGVLDSSDNYVMESAQIGKGDTADRFIGKYEYDHHKVEALDEEVIYIGALPIHWGHFLVDMTYRFWIFDSEQFSNIKIIYCTNKSYFQSVQLEFMKMLGIDSGRLYPVEKPTRFSKIYIPEQGYMACDYFTREYRNTFSVLVNNCPQLKLKPYEKIYLSRGHFRKAQKSEIGEKHIEDNFVANGFQVLYMEELSLAEQVFYISHCKEVAALSGTLCHNILFANSKVTLIILNKTHLINTHQVLINQMIGCKVVYIDLYVEPFKHIPSSYGSGPFLLGDKNLQKYFVDNNMYFRRKSKMRSYYDFMVYIKMCLKLKLKTFFSDLYISTYYKLCRHKLIILPLRFTKNALNQILNKVNKRA